MKRPTRSTSWPGSCAIAVAVAGAVTGLGACGGPTANTTVLRIGDEAISKGVVDHWTAVVERGGAFSGFRGAPTGSPKQRAVALLVSSSWLEGEAVRQGVPVPEADVEQVLSEREQEGAAFRKRLRQTGQSIADLKLEMRAELAAEAIREKLTDRADTVTRQQALDFYRRNPSLFRAPEVRQTDVIEKQSSSAAAKALVGRVGTGAGFAGLAYHEHVARTPGFMRTPEKVRVVNAIFSARPGVVSEPMVLNGSWAVFVVRKIVPERQETFRQAHDNVIARLRASRQRKLKAEFDREYVKLWQSKTKCAPGFIAPGCPQFAKPLGAYEDPFSSRAHPLLSEQGVAG